MRTEARQVEALGQLRCRTGSTSAEGAGATTGATTGAAIGASANARTKAGSACSGMYPGLGSAISPARPAGFRHSPALPQARPLPGGVCGGARQGRYRPAREGRGRRHPRRASSRPSRWRRRSLAVARPERRPARPRAGSAAPARPESRRSEPRSRRQARAAAAGAALADASRSRTRRAPRSFLPSSPCARQASLPGRPRADRRRAPCPRSAPGRADRRPRCGGVVSTTGAGVSAIGSSATCANKGVEDKAMTAAIAVMAGRILVFLWVIIRNNPALPAMGAPFPTNRTLVGVGGKTRQDRYATPHRRRS